MAYHYLWESTAGFTSGEWQPGNGHRNPGTQVCGILMSKSTFNPEIKAVLDQFLLGIPGVTAGTMFGYPAYYIRGKLFACVYESGVGIKVPEKTAKNLAGMPGFSFFQPLGRAKMKAWIFLERSDPEDYAKELPLFTTSIEYVSSLADEKK